MSDIVVDSSVVAKWVLPEPDSPQAQRLIDEVAGQGNRLIILDLAMAEVSNAIWKQQRRKLITTEEATQFLEILISAPVQIEPALRVLPQAMEIAIRHDRSVYDALFVALAVDLDVQGVTADEPLYNALHQTIPHVVLLRNWSAAA